MSKHFSSVDQSDRLVPYNLRQSGETPVEMLIFTRVRKSPFWHLSVEAGCWRATIYNRIYHPFGYVRPENGGPMVEYEAIKNHVTMWDVAVERQIMVKGPDSESFVDYVITRDATEIKPMRAKYVVLCNNMGGVLNDPVLLRLSKDEFWFSLADSDVGMYLQGVNHDNRFNVVVDEIDVCTIQIQGPKSRALMNDLFGSWINDLKYYWCKQTDLNGIPVVVSRTGWSGEIGYEVYLRDGKRGADLYEKIMAAGKQHKIAPTGPSQIRRVEAGIFSYFQDMRVTDNPFEIGMDRLVDLEMEADFVGKEALKKIKKEGIKRKLVGIEILGDPISKVVPPQYTPGYFVPDHWPVFDDKKEIGYVTSKCFSPRLKKNIGYAFIPIDYAKNDTEIEIRSPYANLKAKVVPLPFFDPKKKIPIK